MEDEGIRNRLESNGQKEPNTPSVETLLANNVTSFPSIAEAGDALATCFSSYGSSPDTRVLLIGDASHGTSEFYTARVELTKYMIQHHGFNIVAVEADWPDAEAVDRYVRHRKSGPGPRTGPGMEPGLGSEASVEGEGEAKRAGREAVFMRFPRWMWRNQEVRGFVEWLRGWNEGKEVHDAVGFYGLDLYSLGGSMHAVIEYLDQVDKEMADVARDRYGKLMGWAGKPHGYGLETLVPGFKGYEDKVMDMLRKLLQKRLEYSSVGWDGVEFHSSEQNARLVKDAEHYYKAMYYDRDESWNIRDTHMFETLVRVLKHRGDGAKAIVWAHNSHVGDARATSMGRSRGDVNIGQLCKEAFGSRGALAIGCLGHTGTVAAAHRWDGDMQVMKVRPGLPGSYEEVFHGVGAGAERGEACGAGGNFVLDMREGVCDAELRGALMRERLERFIGVIYRPEMERQAHYSSAVLPEQFDGLVWFDESRHVGVLEVHQPDNEEGGGVQ